MIGAGCAELVQFASSIVSAVRLVLQLNFTLASQLVQLVSCMMSTLLLLLQKSSAAVYILLDDLAAFLEDVVALAGAATHGLGDACGAAAGVVSAAAGRLRGGLQLLGDVLSGSLLALAEMLQLSLLLLADAVVTLLRCLLLMYETVVQLLTLVPRVLLAMVCSLAAQLQEGLDGLLYAVLSLYQLLVTALQNAAVTVFNIVCSTPPEALLGLAIVSTLVFYARTALRDASRRRLTAAIRRLSQRCVRVCVQLVGPPLLRLCVGLLALCETTVTPFLVLYRLVCAALRLCIGALQKWTRRRPRAPALSAAGDACSSLDKTPPETRRLRAALEQQEECRSCVVCREHEKTIILLPCRHMCLCQTCCDVLLMDRRQCPVCRTRIRNHMSVYT